MGLSSKSTKNSILTVFEYSKNTFFGEPDANRRIIPKTYLGKLLTFCPVNLSLKSLLYGKNQGGDTFGKNDCVLIVGTFLILRAIGYLIFLNAMFLFKYIKEVNFGQTICNFATGL